MGGIHQRHRGHVRRSKGQFIRGRTDGVEANRRRLENRCDTLVIQGAKGSACGQKMSGRTREDLIRRGIHLSYITIGYNSLEAITSLVAGLVAGSVALIGFGVDSLVEVTPAE